MKLNKKAEETTSMSVGTVIRMTLVAIVVAYLVWFITFGPAKALMGSNEDIDRNSKESFDDLVINFINKLSTTDPELPAIASMHSFKLKDDFYLYGFNKRMPILDLQDGSGVSKLFVAERAGCEGTHACLCVCKDQCQELADCYTLSQPGSEGATHIYAQNLENNKGAIAHNGVQYLALEGANDVRSITVSMDGDTIYFSGYGEPVRS